MILCETHVMRLYRKLIRDPLRLPPAFLPSADGIVDLSGGEVLLLLGIKKAPHFHAGLLKKLILIT